MISVNSGPPRLHRPDLVSRRDWRCDPRYPGKPSGQLAPCCERPPDLAQYSGCLLRAAAHSPTTTREIEQRASASQMSDTPERGGRG